MKDFINNLLGDNTQKEGFALGLANYKLLAIGLAIIILGFVLMAGGGSEDPNVFDESIYDFRHITLAPIVVLIGFGFEVYAIMKK
ncbi:MAG: DUF3098 domain-containing protein [Bacteroidales bacterium]|nr:DUF3098 domain-containing protein [Bacteroidales bacterium]MDD5816205.1 DUF3098 domain-containing protein [Bacteroidales bacterium]MDY4520514.1 DUF3098 domain-containing protein [Bacteroidales bacterium]